MKITIKLQMLFMGWKQPLITNTFTPRLSNRDSKFEL